MKDEPPTFMDVSANYFTTVGMRIVRGRGFDPDPGWTIVINESMEHQYWPRGDAIGQCMWLSTRGGQCYRIVGVSENAHRRGVIEKPHAHYFVPLLHPFSKGMAGYTIIVRANPDRMAEVTLGMQRILKDAFPTGRPTIELTANRLAPAYRPFRLGATLFTALGVLALVVSSLGIYSSVAYSVTQRTHEFGVRVALGAQASDVVRGVLRQALTPIVVGVTAGVGIALAGGKVVESLLYDVSPRDAIVIAGVPLLLLTAAVAAALVPSTRAARVDPVVALRAD
jgi:putative ABC transport system permease protein